MANTFRGVGATRNAYAQGALASVGSPLASGFMAGGIGKGSRRSVEHLNKSTTFLNDYLGTLSGMGESMNDMAAQAGRQGMEAIGNSEVFKAQKAAAESAKNSSIWGNIAGIGGTIAGFLL